jgi:galactose mutarotase-like enzyme
MGWRFPPPCLYHVAMQDRHVIHSGYLTAAIKADGAELCSLCDATGEEMLWQGQPIWPRHAPVLFPIVGRLKDDTLRHNGRTYRLTQHGFARDHRFAWLNRTATSCRLVLHDDATTRAVYPFAFRFEVAFALEDDALVNTFTVINTGRETLPASVGAHPGFRWPLSEGIDKSTHVLEFDAPEPAPIRRLQGGLLGPSVPTPIEGATRGPRRSRWRGMVSASLASGCARAAISCASSPGAGRIVRPISTASFATSRGSC